MSKTFAFILAVLLSGLTVLADYFIKKESLGNTAWNKWLLLGALIYSLTALGWVFAMRNMKLAILGGRSTESAVLPY